jgi:GNAT superfamily N-acetyltransferase
MAPTVTFMPYLPTYKEACLKLFDANCPEFFDPNERTDYENFLEANPKDYELCFVEGSVVGAFGLMGDGTCHRNLSWILLDPSSQGLGIGAMIMERVVLNASESDVRVINIAASHKSAPFFAKFGSTEVTVTTNGWGPGIHRVDMVLRL